MKRIFAVLSPMLFFVCTLAHAQFSINIAVDEQGNGTFTNTNGYNSGLTSGMLADTGPGGAASALTYNLFNPPGLTNGDLFLQDSNSSTSDLIRFNANENGGSLVFYSTDSLGALADRSLPTSFYENQFTLAEGNGVVSYTPTAGQPGFVAGAGGSVTYTITSAPATPEPSSLALLGTGIAGLVGVARRRLFA